MRLALVSSAAVALAGCSGSTGPSEWDYCPDNAVTLGSIRLKPSAISVRRGDQLFVYHELLALDGRVLSVCGAAPTFSTEDSTVATANNLGIVRGVSVGQTTLHASYGGKSTTAIITVTSNILEQLDVSASHATLLLGQVTSVSATARDAGGNVVLLQSTPWISDNPAIASVTPGGTVVARGVGSATIRLTIGGRTATTSISIDTGPPRIRMSSVSAGGRLSCALAAGGNVPTGTAFCWGLASDTGAQRTPVRVPGTLVFRSISAGDLSVCGISTAGESYCWGWNTVGELGVGDRTARFSPQRVSGTATYVSVVAAAHMACGLLSTGRVNCWGESNQTEALLIPTPLAGALTFVELTGGNGGPGGVCGRTATGAVYCWNVLTRWHVVAPALASGTSVFASVSVGGLYNCGMTAAGSASCWRDIRDQLGSGITAGNYAAPVAVPGGLTFQSIAATGAFFCGITDTGTWCHGPTGLLNSTGGSPLPRLVPLLDPPTQFVRISGGYSHACALDSRSAIWCWGVSPTLGLLDINRPPEPLQLRFE